jgi:DNA polymerase-3 subunit gamma/tau
LQFNLKQMPPENIVAHLTNVLTAESVHFDTKALQLLARAAQGSMRDALSLTDQAIAYSAGQVSFESVEQMLGAVDTRYLFDLFDALAERDGAKLLGLAQTMAERSLPFGSVLQDMASMAYQLSVASVVPSVIEGDPHAETLFALAAKIPADELQLIYQIATHARMELQHAPDEAIGFGMALLRMLAFVPNTGSVKPGGQAALSTDRATSGGTARIVGPAAVSESLPASNTVSVFTASSNDAPVFPSPSEWPSVAQVLKATGLTRQCLEQSEWVSVTQNNERWVITLRVPIKTYAEPGLVKRVQQLLEQHFACGIDVNVQVGQTNHTAFAVESSSRIEKQKMAEQAIQADPFIHELKQQMGAEIIVGSVRPLA